MKIIAVLLCSILIFGASNAENNENNTTTSTSTTPPTTTSTTSTPITTSTASTTSTTAGPTTTLPPPVPENHKWFVNETNHTCIIVQMTVTLNIAVNITNNSTLKKEILIPVNQTSVTTNCSEGSEQFMKLSWKSTEKLNASNNSIVIYFKKFEKSFDLDHFTVEIAPEEFPQANRSAAIKLKHLLPHYNTTSGCSYRVSKKQEFNLMNESDKLASGYLDVIDLQFQAFRKDNTTYFAEVCDFETPDVVPIAVGCVLAGLVVIVLAAYLISRKRSQARGYLSM